MAYLNGLGANVRNHMSTIEDKFVDEARQAFPAAQKQPRIANSNRPLTAEEVKRELFQTKPSAKEQGSPVKQPAATVAPRPAQTAINDRPNPVRTGMPGMAQAKPEIPKTANNAQPAQNQQRPQPPSQPAKSQVTQPNVPHSNAPRSNNTPYNNQARPSAPQAHSQGQTGRENQRPAESGANKAGMRESDRRPENKRPIQQDADRRGERGPNQNMPRTAAAVNNNRQGAPRDQRYQGQNQGRPAPNNQNRPEARTQDGNRNQTRPGGKPGLSNQRQNQGAPHSQNQQNNRRPAQQGGRFDRRNASGQQQSRGPVGGRFGKPTKPEGPATTVKSVQLPSQMTVKDFSQLIEVSASDVIKKLMGLGVMATINQEIDMDTMTLIAVEYGISATAAQTEEEKLQIEEIEDDPATLVTRPPVVTIMGHVDHGKTSLLDAIRQTNVTAQEAGGITQHIGAYQVELNDRKITFLDTPGHAAFTAMRARGAQVTDIAILVVAADDGVMPQTVEAINHAKDANVSIIIAINKMDKPGANPDRIKQDLTEYGLVAEEWGGDTIFVPVSAKKRTGIEQLLEMILLVADVKDYRANPNRAAKGTIVEAQLDKGRGPVATVLVQTGTLQVGDSIIAGAAAGKVRVLNNDKGKRVKKAGPSTPVEVIGFTEVPEAGDIVQVVSEERLARELADKRMQFKREAELKKNQKITLDDLFSKIKEGEIKELKIIIKADVQGSVEAIRQSLERLSNDEVRVKVIHGGVGAIGEGDVMFASASNAIIVGFNVRPDPSAKRIAEKDGVDIRLYRIIYNIIEDVQKALEGMLAPEYQEIINGRAEVRAVYKVPKVGNIAGSYVLEGKISRNSDIRLIRDNIVIHEGKIESLKRFKDDAREVLEGFECGIGIEKFNDIKEGDIIEAFAMEEIKRSAKS